MNMNVKRVVKLLACSIMVIFTVLLFGCGKKEEIKFTGIDKPIATINLFKPKGDIALPIDENSKLNIKVVKKDKANILSLLDEKGKKIDELSANGMVIAQIRKLATDNKKQSLWLVNGFTKKKTNADVWIVGKHDGVTEVLFFGKQSLENAKGFPSLQNVKLLAQVEKKNLIITAVSSKGKALSKQQGKLVWLPKENRFNVEVGEFAKVKVAKQGNGQPKKTAKKVEAKK